VVGENVGAVLMREGLVKAYHADEAQVPKQTMMRKIDFSYRAIPSATAQPRSICADFFAVIRQNRPRRLAQRMVSYKGRGLCRE
jgi:hypothetical protein